FNTIGPRQSGQYGMVVPRFITQALEGKDLTVYGSGSQSRCFTYVSDATEWLYLLGESDEAVGQVLNLGNPEEITILDLALKVIAVTGSSSGIRYIPYEQAYESGFEDMLRRVPDITKVTELTGRQPQVNLEQALSRTRDWFLNQAVVEEAQTAHLAL
ncbi:MAG: NAD-dependent epimerase/dehydratase family protein, partial [Bryobacteraceae bacterium]